MFSVYTHTLPRIELYSVLWLVNVTRPICDCEIRGCASAQRLRRAAALDQLRNHSGRVDVNLIKQPWRSRGKTPIGDEDVRMRIPKFTERVSRSTSVNPVQTGRRLSPYPGWSADTVADKRRTMINNSRAKSCHIRTRIRERARNVLKSNLNFDCTNCATRVHVTRISGYAHARPTRIMPGRF